MLDTMDTVTASGIDRFRAAKAGVDNFLDGLGRRWLRSDKVLAFPRRTAIREVFFRETNCGQDGPATGKVKLRNTPSSTRTDIDRMHGLPAHAQLIARAAGSEQQADSLALATHQQLAAVREIGGGVPAKGNSGEAWQKTGPGPTVKNPEESSGRLG